MIRIKMLLLSLVLYSNVLLANSDINKVLDTFHQAAADADQTLYLSLFDEQGVFLGTDGTERWTKKQFADFVRPYFSKGQGWLYQSSQRNITIVKQKNGGEQVAFFDELLDNKNYGKCRGSGVLRLTAQGWKILQYNLSIPVPNAVASDVVETIKKHQQQAQ